MRSVGSRDGQRRVIIIGGGASGVLMACHLLRRRPDYFVVTLIEKRPDVGRGIAYHTANPDHLLNVRAANMSAFPDEPEHFWKWLCARRDSGELSWGPCDDPFCFVPRKFYGDYIASLIEPLLCDSARSGCLRIIHGECVSIEQDRDGVVATLANRRGCDGDFAVLATGHETANHRTGPYVDPWTEPAAVGVMKDSRILILGTGLTMVDYVLSLILTGHTGPITALSRHGLLPRAHRKAESFEIRREDVPFGAGTRALVRWLRRIVSRHAAQAGDWRSVIDGLRPFTQDIWQQMSSRSRRVFLHHVRAWWDVHRHRMAPEVESQITAAIESGLLTVMAGKLSALELDHETGRVWYRRRGADVGEVIEVDRIVDCRGIGADPLKVANPVLRSLFESGQARADALRIGLDVSADCALIDNDGVASERLFAIGPLTRAAFWEIIAIPDIRNQCVALADHLAGSALGANPERVAPSI